MAGKYEDIKGWDLTGISGKTARAADPPDADWTFDGKGMAWIYYGHGNNKTLTNPVILSDGFHADDTKLNTMWDGLEKGAYPFISELRKRGHDVIILGYQDCTASMLRNAEVAEACIRKAADAPTRKTPLIVGGFSMGGIITRYVLAKMEHEAKSGGKGHLADTYLCYDSPHHGAWIPIAIQAMALTLRGTATYRMITSDAARQLLWSHLSEVPGTPGQDPKRGELMAELARVGNWPKQVQKIGVANGKGKGSNGVPPGELALRCHGLLLKNVELYTQSSAQDFIVAKVGPLGGTVQKTDGLPEADGAHGGMLDGFGLAADELKKLVPDGTVCHHRDHGFVPTGSAIAAPNGERWLWQNLGETVGTASALNAFECADDNEAHTLMTPKLGSWLVNRIEHQRK